MYRFRLAVFLFLTAALAAPLLGQVTKISSSTAFSEESVRFDFEAQQGGTDAADLLSRWGVRFHQDETTRPRIVLTLVIEPVRFLENFHPGGSSAGLPLVIDFRFPVRRVGFNLGNGNDQTQVTLTAFGPLGQELGQVTQSGIAADTFLGVNTTDSRGISKVILSYGDSASPERIDNLTIEYLDRPVFTTFLSQLGDGPIPGVGSLQTTLVVSNLSNSTAQAELEIFQSDGSPLSLRLDGQDSSAVDLEIPPFSSKTFTSSGTASPVSVGYARVRANVPVEGTAIFRVLSENGSVTTEAGVGSAAGKFLSVGAVQKEIAGNFDSGIAVVNTSGEPSDATVVLFDESGVQVGLNVSEFDLEGNRHKAMFLSQLFPEIQDENFKGSLAITSDQPLAMVIVRTASQIVLSSLPVGSTQE